MYGAANSYDVTLTVTDDLGATNSVTHSFSPSAPNQAPLAAFTGSCTDLSCSFDGSGSSDPDGTIASYSWDFGDAQSGAGANPTHVYGAANSYDVTLTVTDDLGATNSVTQSFTVSDGSNQAPVAAFTGDCTDLSCSFDGSGSSDPDGTIASYSWDFGDTQSGAGANPTHVYGAANSYDVTLTVTDDLGATSSVTQSFTVSDGSNQAPVAAFTGDCTDLSCSFDGSGSSDPDGTIASYSWDFGDTQSGAGANPTHVYGAANSYDVTLTVTDDLGATNSVTQSFTVSDGSNQAPVAAFTGDCTDLSCSFDGSGSSDPDGTIASYSWDFGDTQSGTGATVDHTYGAANSYDVTLTVTDDLGATSSVTHSFSPSAPNQAPVAAFTGDCTDLSCSFDGSGSSDADGSIGSYSWDFGDGSPVGAGVSVGHTFAGPGPYTVTLTVTDDKSATDATSQAFDVSVSAVVASDSFGRSVASGWASADVGGAYAASQGVSSGSTAVGFGAGVISLSASPSGRGFYLPGVSVLNSDSVVDVSTNPAPAGGTYGQVAYITARRVSATTEYRVRLRFLPNGAVHLSFVKTVGNTTEVVIGSEVTVSGLTDVAGRVFRLRFDVSGASPTTLQAKVWLAGDAEPAGWQLSATDGQAALQVAGSPGLRAYLGGSATNQPSWLFDNFTVTNLSAGGNLPPVAAFTGDCTDLSCSFDGSGSSDADGSIGSYSWDFGDGSPVGAGVSVGHTFAGPGPYTVTLTVTDDKSATDATSQAFDVSVSAVVASDSFGRSVASGWASADVGGAYAASQGVSSGSTAVGFGAGVISLSASPSGRGFYLPGVSVLNSDSVVDVSTNPAPAGGTYGQVAYITARRVSATTEYRVRLRFLPNGAVHLSFVKTVGNTTEVVVGSEVTVSGLTDVAGRVFRLRFDVSGASPTTLQAKVWLAGDAEPAGWQLSATDGQAALQVAGSPGLRAYLGGSATNQPAWLFDNFTVTQL